MECVAQRSADALVALPLFSAVFGADQVRLRGDGAPHVCERAGRVTAYCCLCAQKDRLRVFCDLFGGRCIYKQPIAEARGVSASMRMRVLAAAKGAAAAEAAAATAAAPADEFTSLVFALNADDLDCVSVVAAGALSTTPSEVRVCARADARGTPVGRRAALIDGGFSARSARFRRTR